MVMKPLALIKCPYCKGETRQDRRTLYLYPTDTYWCARCKASGSVTDLDLSSVNLSDSFTIQSRSVVTQYQYNNTGERFSVCRQRYSDNRKDVFQIKSVEGSLVGHYTRYKDKHSHIEGRKLFCYREDFLVPGGEYRLVEGVYDCIYPNDVALLGYPSYAQVKELKYYRLILCPDGDVWKSLQNLKKWLFPFSSYKNVVVEYIPNSLDPDECPQEKRKQIELDKIINWIKDKDNG